MTNPYWFSIEELGRRHGGAFLITKKYALTATHCLPTNFEAESDSEAPSTVRLIAENGVELRAKVSEVSGDVALLEISAFGRHNILPPETCHTIDQDALWDAPYRPSLQHPTLAGVIGNPGLQLRCSDGTLITAIQLRVSEGIGDHSGYSGGPVVSKATGSKPASVFGMLIEQFPDQADLHRSANVLFAARVSDAFEIFEAFNGARRLNLRTEDSTIVSSGIANSGGNLNLTQADELIRQAKQWTEDKVITRYEFKSIKTRISDILLARVD